jgi:hypothetical protein
MKFKFEVDMSETETLAAFHLLNRFLQEELEIDGVDVSTPQGVSNWPDDPYDVPDDPCEDESEDFDRGEQIYDEGDMWEQPTKDIEFPHAVNEQVLQEANTAPIWTTISLSAASTPFEEEAKASLNPDYLRAAPTPVTAPTPVAAPAPSRNPDLPKLSDELRSATWDHLAGLLGKWCQNFGEEGEQPDRLEALRVTGTGRFALPILILAFELGSLQKVIFYARHGADATASLWSDEEKEFCDRIAANMVQISHMVYPDLAGTYDYSTKWRRG